MNTYTNTACKNKERGRNLYLKYLLKNFSTDKYLNLFSLPHSNFLFEGKVREAYSNSNIFTIENNLTTYKEGLNKAKILNINHNYGDAFNYLNDTTRKYDAIWLDLCNNISPELINKLIPIIQGRNTYKETIFGLTITGAREYKLPKMLDFYNSKSLADFRNYDFHRVLKVFASYNGFKLNKLKLYKYQSIKNTSMYLYIFKIKSK